MHILVPHILVATDPHVDVLHRLPGQLRDKPGRRVKRAAAETYCAIPVPQGTVSRGVAEIVFPRRTVSAVYHYRGSEKNTVWSAANVQMCSLGVEWVTLIPST